MKNSEVVNNWINGKYPNKTKNLFYEGNVIYSYGYHFPICIKFIDGFLFNKCGYSMTTAHHKGMVKRAIYGKILEVDIKVLHEVIAKNIASLKELENSEFFNSL